MLWVGSITGKKYNPQGKFRHELRESEDPAPLERISEEQAGRESTERAQPPAS